MRSVRTSLFLGLIALHAIACADARNEPLNEGITPPRLGPGAAVDARPAPGPADGPAGTVPRDPRCPEGQHMCEQGGCVDNTSYKTCGLGCTECPGITGGMATCNGVTCGVTCPAGSKPCQDACVPEATTCDTTSCPAGKNRCGDICVEATSLSSCGPACKPCPSSLHGKSSCDGEKCDLTCDDGYHRCDDECVRDDDTDKCGAVCSKCEPPTGGTAACKSNRCEAECPATTKLCFGACIPMEKSCDGMCLEGKHDCRGNCVPNTDTATCGPTSCDSPCQPPPNADATCDGTICGFTCKAGYHRCGDTCKSDMSPETCGPTECTTACTAPTGGTATCDGKACGFRCDDGRKCDNKCIGDDTPCNGSCPSGRSLCGSTSKCVPSGTITSEKCDGQDNDCDGKIDDGLTDTCSNRCGASATIRCVNGNWDRNSCPGNPRCCNSGECNDDQTCSGGTCKPLTCPKCRVADNNNCDTRAQEGTGCGGDNQCDNNGNCVPSCGRIGLRCCGSGGNGGCSQGFCDGGTCTAKLKDGEACSQVRNNQCEHQCMGYCDPVHADNRRRCLSNLECFDPATGAESTCLEDSPECATPERRD